MKKLRKTISAPTVIIIDNKMPSLRCPELKCTSSLSWLIAGKPIARHLMEELQSLGVLNCFILSGGNGVEISQLIKDELHFSSSMRVEVLNYEVDAETALQRFSSLATESGLLIIETTSFTECCIKNFLEKCSSKKDILFSAQKKTEPLGLTYLAKNAVIGLSRANKIEMPVQHIELQSTSSYIESNLSLLNGDMPGRFSSLANNSALHWQHNRSYISKKANLQNIRFVDRGSYISAGCELNNAVVHKDCVIEKNVILNNVVLLPGTWVSQNQTLENSLISERNIYPI